MTHLYSSPTTVAIRFFQNAENQLQDLQSEDRSNTLFENDNKRLSDYMSSQRKRRNLHYRRVPNARLRTAKTMQAVPTRHHEGHSKGSAAILVTH